MKKITLSLFLALGSMFTNSYKAQCVANGTITPTSTPGEFTITDLSTVSSTGYSFFSASDGGYLSLQPSTTTGTYQFPANGVYTYYFAVMDSTSILCWDTLVGTIAVTGMSSTASCQASFNIQADSTNPSVYWAWNTSVGSTPAAGLSYSWDFGDGTTSTLAYPSHTYSSVGTYAICLTIAELGTSCTSTYCDSIQIFVKASGTTINVLAPGATASVEEVSLITNVTAFPNPTDGQLSIELSAKSEGNVQVMVTNISGQEISNTTKLIHAGNNLISVDAASFTNGIYFVTLSDVNNGSKQTIRFFKK